MSCSLTRQCFDSVGIELDLFPKDFDYTKIIHIALELNTMSTEPTQEGAEGLKSFAQRTIDEVDNFPHPDDDPMGYVDTMRDYYRFHVAGIGIPLGYIREDISWRISQQQNYPFWQVDPVGRTFTLDANSDYSRSLRVQKALETLGQSAVADVDASLEKKLKSATPVYSGNGELLFRIEHGAAKLFGVPDYSVTLIAWTSIEGARYYWVPKVISQTTPGQKVLKNFVSAALSFNEKPLACMIKAMLQQTDARWWYTSVNTAGRLSYHSLRDGYSQPEVQYVYEAITEKKDEDEIKSKGYNLMSFRAISEALKAGEFEPDAEMAYLDHFVRHGLVTIKHEPNLAEIQSKLHGRLDRPQV